MTSTPFLLLLALALAAFALVTGLPSHPRMLGVLNNAAHVPVFGALAIVTHRILKREARLEPRALHMLSFLSTIAAGVAVELVQPLVGKDRELQDLWTDALGAAAGLAVVELRKPGRNRAAGAVLVTTLAAAAWPIVEAALAYLERYRQIPALLEITSPSDWFFIWTHGMQTAQSELPGPWRRLGDPTSVRIQVERDPWRVLTLTEPAPDWRQYGRLMIDLTNPEPRSLELTLRVHDRQHDNEYADRFNRRISAPAETRLVIEIPVAEIAAAPDGRQMELSQIAGVMLFAGREPQLAGQEFYLTRIWLASARGPESRLRP